MSRTRGPLLRCSGPPMLALVKCALRCRTRLRGEAERLEVPGHGGDMKRARVVAPCSTLSGGSAAGSTRARGRCFRERHVGGGVRFAAALT